MKINNASFIKSFADIKTYIEESGNYDLPEICVAGRSNVGKSSLINMLCRQNKLARTSQTPGRTRLINIFNIGEVFMLVDLPGYGYAKASKSEIAKWSRLTDGYFTNTKKLKHTLCLVDIRHEPSDLDKQMVQYLYAKGLPFTVVATKSDKLSRSQQNQMKGKLASALTIGAGNIILTSAQTAQGKEELLSRLDEVLKELPEVPADEFLYEENSEEEIKN